VSTPAPRSLTLVSVGVAALVVLADQLSKTWAVRHLSGGRTVEVIGSLRFNLTFNSGMAFSQGRGVGPFIGVVALAVIVVLLVSLRRTGSMLSAVGIGLVVGGAIGNVADRLFRAGDEADDPVHPLPVERGRDLLTDRLAHRSDRQPAGCGRPAGSQARGSPRQP